MKKIDIYIADDHRIFAQGIEAMLVEQPNLNVLGIASNGKQLLSMMENKKADMVLLDVEMPELNGRETAEILLKNYPETRILMLTMYNTIEQIAPLIKIGIKGYLLKNTGKRELLLAIDTIAIGKNYYSAEVTEVLATDFKQYTNEQVKLSKREIEILNYVFLGLSTTEIGDKIFLSPRTVETHRSNLLAKTGSKNTAQLIQYGLKNGLLKVQNG